MKRYARMWWVGLLTCIACAAGAQVPVDVPAESAPSVASDDGIVDMGVVVVTGAQPGPGLWRVIHGEHTLYVLGEISPLPRDMQWLSGEVEEVVAGSQAIIAGPSLSMGSDIGRFRGLLLVPSLLKARRNPDGKRLEDVVPAPMYARWVPLKARWIGRNNGVERWRPIFAAQELYGEAIKGSGLRQASVVQPVVWRIAKANGIPVIDNRIEVKVENPKALIREFSSGPLDDIDCFDRMLTRIEHDLQHMGQRANAWAVGDIETLRALPVHNTFTGCMRVLTEGELARRLGVDDVEQRLERQWLASAEQALAEHPSTFAMLPMALVLGEDGYLAKLAAKGYEVEAP